MRILRITVSNIASLAGTQTVDFTAEPLRNTGLFSISGPTGAGKSSLLDGLCLALYNTTPRLQQVGLLAELPNGEKQKDPRSLLRRGTAEGFAEVGFVGCDGASYTARWSVRRSHLKPTGNLREVEMVLFQGHIDPHGEGIKAAGGRKTEVLAAIEQKVGLSFAQFTRAVMLAQNDFATFLKASDRERAEILQALTGTEYFEAISRAAFERSAAEKRTLDMLQAQLEGIAPLSAEERTAAEASRQAAEDHWKLIERQLQQRQRHCEWFHKRTELLQLRTTADLQYQEAIASRDAAAERRSDLNITETVCRDGRPLRVAELQTAKTFKEAAAGSERAVRDRDQCLAEFHRIELLFGEVEKRRLDILAEQCSTQSQLNRARELEAQFEPLKTQLEKCRRDRATARTAHQLALQKFHDAVRQRDEGTQHQRALRQQQEPLAAFAPFMTEAALWLHRLDAVIAEEVRVAESRTAAAQLQQELEKLTNKLDMLRADLPEQQKRTAEADGEFQKAQAAERAFDPDQLAQNRTTAEQTHQVLTAFLTQLRDVQRLRDAAVDITSEIEQQVTLQASDAQQLQRLRDHDVPQAERGVEVATSQLELIQAAVDDHTRRLRLTLQDGRECPVCGSVSHPYSHHAPDADSAAVNAARKSVRDLEALRDGLRRQRTTLETSVDLRENRLTEQRRNLQKLQRQQTLVTFDSPDHPAVAAALRLSDEKRCTATEQQLRDLTVALQDHGRKEQQHRDAVRQTQLCRSKMEQLSAALQQVTDNLSRLDTQRQVVSEQSKNAADKRQSAEVDHANGIQILEPLWIALPTAREAFAGDSTAFRKTFADSTDNCLSIERQLQKLTAKIQQAEAALKPLQESVQNAQSNLTIADAAVQSAAVGHDLHLQQRRQLLGGRAVNDVEAEFEQRLRMATQAWDQAAGQKIDADKALSVANSDVEEKTQLLFRARSEFDAASKHMADWLAEFSRQSARSLSEAEIDFMLSRDDAWLKAEHRALEALDHAVTSAASARTVHTEKLRSHTDSQPTLEDEPTVMAALHILQQQIGEASEVLDKAKAILYSDDERIRQNEQLRNALQTQRSAAEPWLRLNDMIGAADGAKFRMIAQRHTLDILLSYANAHLDQLAGRYCLNRLPDSLNLIVLDRDMADERRSIHSLSGGESFLVSLALALGLASLTSNRLSIESLFIDEGFGSLDTETLNTAMTALMHLEAQGRKIGIISHVAEMTDAIPVQIRIVREQNGASRIVMSRSQCEPTN